MERPSTTRLTRCVCVTPAEILKW